MSHYRGRTTPAWPSFPGRISFMGRSLDEIGPEELVEQADLILARRFALRHFRRGLPDVSFGDQIDWQHNPTSDPRARWTRELHRHRWWAILALAYAETGDERYAAEFVSVMTDWAQSVLPPTVKDETDPAWTLMGVGMRCVIWPTTFASFYHSPAFTDQAKLTMLRSIYDHGRFLSLFKTRNNHLLRESNGLAYLSVYFPEFKEAGLWRQVALRRLDDALGEQINPDGSHVEMSTGYQWLVVEEFQATYDLLQAHGLSLPQEELAPWLEKMYHWLAYLVRPDGNFSQLNDGVLNDQSTLLTRLAQAGEAFGREDIVYIGTGGKRGARPTANSVRFDDAGLYVMRSDWSRGAHYLLFDAGPHGGDHGHEDKLSFELLAYGQPFIVDPGSYTYNDTDPFRSYFVSSQGHNTVLVDGQSQIRRWQRDRPTPKTAVGDGATWISQPDFDYVSASYSDGYGVFSLEKPTDAQVFQDVTHTRRILFVKPNYWVIVDELEASALHDYQVLFHTAPEIAVKAIPGNKTILRTGKPQSVRLDLIPAEPQSVEINCITGIEIPIQGWYSAGFEHKTPATTIIYEGKNRSSTTMAFLLYPRPAGQTDDQVSIGIEPLAVSGGRGLAFLVTTSGGSDYLLLAQDERLKRFGPYQSRAIVAGIRTDRQGNVRSQFEWPNADELRRGRES